MSYVTEINVTRHMPQKALQKMSLCPAHSTAPTGADVGPAPASLPTRLQLQILFL